MALVSSYMRSDFAADVIPGRQFHSVFQIKDTKRNIKAAA